MKKLSILLLSIVTLGVSVSAQSNKDYNINFKQRASLYAATSIEDPNAIGGFGGSSNNAQPINSKSKLNHIDLFIDTSKTVVYHKEYNGYQLSLINYTDSITGFEAADSRLSIIAEVFYKGKWQAIEYLPSSWCGNSYHTVYLKPNEFWSFNIPKFTGEIKTKLRYKLNIGNGKTIFSNEIEASFNKGQLNKKEGHSPKGIMDPYND